MFLESDLRFLSDVFEKCHIRLRNVTPQMPLSELTDPHTSGQMGKMLYGDIKVADLLPDPKPHTLYKATDANRLSSACFQLPSATQARLVFVGPFLQAPLSQQQLLEIAERNGILPKHKAALSAFYETIPVITRENPVFLMLDAFCQRVFGLDSFTTLDVNQERRLPVSPITEAGSGNDFDEVLFNVQAIEQRYAYENELIEAVRLGHSHRLTGLFSNFNDSMFQQRAADPLRNLKNYCIIMNTLLRKAAESGGVHPIYIDSVSSGFALRIEQLSAIEGVKDLMHEMATSYCRLTRKHSMKNYSPLVQKCIIFIESDLSANLSLHTISKAQRVSPGYLSTLFRKETGKTLTEYIRTKRIEHATHLLSTTHLQIQTVALHCGIMDVHYFSKIFKQYTGKTPKEYRASVK